MSAEWGITLQAIYDSEINFRISTFWDGGFTWELGDDMNGFVKSGTTFTFGEAVEELAHAVHGTYPDSVFHMGKAAYRKAHPEMFAEHNINLNQAERG